jgi:hypothetical protein
MNSSLPSNIRRLGDKAWLDLLVRSIDQRRVEGVEFPGFPSIELQAAWVGSANEATLREAFAFYQLLKKYAKDHHNPLTGSSRFLDFGCGWGRFLRFFWKDVDDANLYGCDVDEMIVETCLRLGVPGQIDLISANGSLPYPDDFFDIMMGYSVFTHLPEAMHIHWMRELARVARRGCIFALTLEPRRFIDFLAAIPEDTPVDWYRSLSSFKPRVADFRRSFDDGNLVFMTTNEDPEVTYGDAVVPVSYIKQHWAPYFKVIAYIDDPKKFWQAVLVVQRV